jgi:hypothetical protein
MAIPTILVNALRRLYSRLENENVEWALVGSLGLAIRGAPIEPKDIDLMTDKDGAYQIEQLFSDFITYPVSFKTSNQIESHFGALNIDGVKVEIMGDFRIHLEDGGWHGPPDFSRFKEVKQFEEMPIPVLSLEWEYDSYHRLGREDRAEMVKRLLMPTERRP